MTPRTLGRRFIFCAVVLVVFLANGFAHFAMAQPNGKTGASVAASSANASTQAVTTATQGTTSSGASHSTHTVTVTFDYDFRQTPACTSKVTTHCVMQFIAYDISAGAKTPTMLFPIPLPPNPQGLVKGITRVGPALDFESGKHLIAVSAMSADGSHSKRNLCTTWITIP